MISPAMPRVWLRRLPTATRRGSWTGRSRSRPRSRCPRATATGWPSRRAAASALYGLYVLRDKLRAQEDRRSGVLS